MGGGCVCVCGGGSQRSSSPQRRPSGDWQRGSLIKFATTDRLHKVPDLHPKLRDVLRERMTALRPAEHGREHRRTVKAHPNQRNDGRAQQHGWVRGQDTPMARRGCRCGRGGCADSTWVQCYVLWYGVGGARTRHGCNAMCYGTALGVRGLDMGAMLCAMIRRSTLHKRETLQSAALGCGTRVWH